MIYLLKFRDNDNCKFEIVETLPADLSYTKVYCFESRKEAEKHIRDHKLILAASIVLEVFHLPIVALIKIVFFIKKLGRKNEF